jgi:hypothetical protein
MNSTNCDHPIWDVYDQYRTARLTVRYYEYRLKGLRRNNFIIELMLAISVSAGVAGLWFWGTVVGGIIWKIIITVAAFAAVVKPLLKLPDRIQEQSVILAAWRELDDELQKLSVLVRQCGKYNSELQNRFLSLMEKRSAIVKKETAEAIDEKLREKCFEQVNQELPSDKFFVPGR